MCGDGAFQRAIRPPDPGRAVERGATRGGDYINIAARTSLPQRVQIRRHVARRTLRDAKVGHRRTRLDRLGRLDPSDEIVRRVRRFASYEGATREVGEWRTRQSLRTAHSRHVVAGAATVRVDRQLPSFGIPTGYGTQRGATEATVKYTYEKIYNAWTYFPCSNMPRLGAKGYLTPEQIAHVVAYLVDPQSPVNRK